MNKNLFVFTGLLLCLASLSLEAAHKQSLPDPQLKDARCAEAASAQLGQWTRERHWSHAPIAEDGSTVDKSPTAEVGEWVETRVHPGKTLELVRFSPDRIVNITFEGKECRSKVTARNTNYDEKIMQGAFTDAELKTLIQQNKKGIIYAWSPQMPLSFLGFDRVRKAAKQVGAKAFFVLDPNSDPVSASRALEKFKLGKNDSQKIESLELFFRGVANHYPSTVVFADGKIQGYALNGLQSVETYANQIKR